MAENHDLSNDRSEIAFFDVETTVPTRPGQGYALLEFGLILVCPRTLVEVRSYSTLIKPSNPSLISALSVRCNGITPDAVVSAPGFNVIADTVYDFLHGRIWAGHNIVRFDCVRIKEAFEQIKRPPPEPKGIIDSLMLLTQRFGRRAGDMKMATLATYFGLGKQTHRSLDDVRMNLEVVKYCATVLFLESSLPDIFTEKSWVSPNATTRSRSNGKLKSEVTMVSSSDPSSSSSSDDNSVASPVELSNGRKSNVILKMAAMTAESSFDLRELSDEIKDEALQTDVPMEEKTLQESNKASSPANMPIDQSGHEGFLDPDVVSVAEIKASFNTLFRWSPRMELLHKNVPLKLCCSKLKVRFGISSRFVDHNGRPRLNFVVDAPSSLCGVLDACESVAYKLWEESGSASEWHKVLKRNNHPTVRLNILPAVNSEGAQYATEICHRDPSGTIKNLEFRTFTAAELDPLFSPGTTVDAYISVDPYDYQQNAGIRLGAKKLILYEDRRENAPQAS